MGNIFNPDFRDFIASLNKHGVKYILVGGYSVILHGYSRTTGDMDLWVERSEENYMNIKNAFEDFGMPVFDMTKENFLHHPVWDVFTFGIPPVAIDLMIKLEGFDFQEVYNRAVNFNEDELNIKVIHKNDLIAAKQKAGRSKDLNDLENLT
ncbi:MAG: nucleotidyltransferase [Sphingobacteriales bacterium]|jgi:predicted nucleotidyltransferase